MVHPSYPKLQKYATTNVPLLINSCTTDSQFPLESSAIADEMFGGGKFAPGYKREYFEGCTHGFAVRGDMKDAVAQAAKENSFKATVKWIKEYI